MEVSVLRHFQINNTVVTMIAIVIISGNVYFIKCFLIRSHLLSLKFTENVRDEETEPKGNMALNVTWPIKM